MIFTNISKTLFMNKKIVFFCFCVLCSTQHFAQNVTLKTRNVVTGLDTPWEIIWGADNWIWVTERLGQISRVNPTTGEKKELLKIADAAEVGEGGLLGMVFDPDFLQNKFLYVAYNYIATGNDYREKIVRFTYDSASDKLTQPKILLDNIDGANNHNGCRMIVSPDKKLLLTTGDAQVTSTSQNVKNINGKTLRINLDGTIPSDNPIAGSPVWSWGHRNAQGLVFSPDGKTLYSSEHGANNDDEVNILKKGRNYGWPRIEGFCDNALEQAFCKDSNVVEPIHSWTPTLGVAGMDFYQSNLIPQWKNSLLVTSLKGSRVTQLALNATGDKITKTTDFYTNTYGRLRDICISPDGKVYIATSNKDGRGFPKADDDKIIEIAPTTIAAKENQTQTLTMNLFPNPVLDLLHIAIKTPDFQAFNYKIIDLQGKIHQQGIIENATTQLPIALHNGVYILQLYQQDFCIQQRFTCILR
jgi:aldose sugar dehydrogenase